MKIFVFPFAQSNSWSKSDLYEIAVVCDSWVRPLEKIYLLCFDKVSNCDHPDSCFYYTVKLARTKLPANARNFDCRPHAKGSQMQFI